MPAPRVMEEVKYAKEYNLCKGARKVNQVLRSPLFEKRVSKRCVL
jgi:hypothetical protein